VCLIEVLKFLGRTSPVSGTPEIQIITSDRKVLSCQFEKYLLAPLKSRRKKPSQMISCELHLIGWIYTKRIYLGKVQPIFDTEIVIFVKKGIIYLFTYFLWFFKNIGLTSIFTKLLPQLPYLMVVGSNRHMIWWLEVLQWSNRHTVGRLWTQRGYRSISNCHIKCGRGQSVFKKTTTFLYEIRWR
jgi:hypothetical protein